MMGSAIAPSTGLSSSRRQIILRDLADCWAG